MPHLDLNQALINQFQPQTQPQSIEELLALLAQGEGGTSIVPRSISSTGFAMPQTAPQVTQQTPGLSLSDRLSQSFAPSFDATTLDELQQRGGALSLLGPVGTGLNFALGQLARMQANLAFPTQEPIGFLEDIMEPDIFGRSPLEILQERATGGTGAQRGATTGVGPSGSRVSAGPARRGGGRTGGFGRGRDPGGGASGSPF